jgi:hypothetical protein
MPPRPPRHPRPRPLSAILAPHPPPPSTRAIPCPPLLSPLRHLCPALARTPRHPCPPTCKSSAPLPLPPSSPHIWIRGSLRLPRLARAPPHAVREHGGWGRQGEAEEEVKLNIDNMFAALESLKQQGRADGPSSRKNHGAGPALQQ